MLVPIEWQDVPEVFEEVAMALEGGEMDVESRDEQGSYGEHGYIVIRVGSKKYRLSISKEV